MDKTNNRKSQNRFIINKDKYEELSSLYKELLTVKEKLKTNCRELHKARQEVKMQKWKRKMQIKPKVNFWPT